MATSHGPYPETYLEEGRTYYGEQNPPMVYVPQSPYHQPTARRRRGWGWAWLLFLAIGGGAVYVIVAKPNSPWTQPFFQTADFFSVESPWWAGTWKPQNGEDVPVLELAMREDRFDGRRYRRISGQLVQKFITGYHASVAILTGEASPTRVLFSLSQADPDKTAAGTSPPRTLWYVLAKRGADQADLFELASPPNAPFISRRDESFRVVLLPTDLEKSHRLVASLMRSFP